METSDGERRGKRWRQVMMEEREEMDIERRDGDRRKEERLRQVMERGEGRDGKREKRWRQVMMEERKEMETSDDGGEGRDGERGEEGRG